MNPTLSTFDWQGHRGARGLYPENSIPGFIAALGYPIQTLELDCVVSKDDQVVVSHEPWFSSKFCLHPDGEIIHEEQEQALVLLDLNYNEIKLYDCGSKGNPDFPKQERLATGKPTLKAVFQSIEQYCQETNRPLPYFNIEIKSRPEWDNQKTPRPEKFAQLVYEVVKPYKDKVCIQSFDIRALKAIRGLDKQVVTAFLIGNRKSLDENLQELGYIPEIYSPNHRLVDQKLIEQVHAKQMKIIPWTVNTTERMQELIELGVNGIITDYPDLIQGL